MIRAFQDRPRNLIFICKPAFRGSLPLLRRAVGLCGVASPAAYLPRISCEELPPTIGWCSNSSKMGRLYDLDNNCLLNVLLRVDGQHAHSAVLSCQAFANLWKRHEVQCRWAAKWRLGFGLMCAAMHGRKDRIEKMLEYAEPRQLTRDTLTSAFLQAATYGWADIVELLVAKGGEVQHAEDAALRTACAYGHGDVVKVLLNSGADVHSKGDEALRFAMSHGHQEIASVVRAAAEGAAADADGAPAQGAAPQTANVLVTAE